MLNLEDKEFNYITSYIKTHYGVNLEKKRHLIEGRLSNHIASLGFSNYMEYFESAIRDKKGQEMTSLISKLTTNHTYFLREKSHFDFYLEQVLPWVDKHLGCKDLRVWSAGCSSGQEPYTLAILAAEYLGSDRSGWDTTLLASDISDKVLDTAKKGIYAGDELAHMPALWKSKYFVRIDDQHYQVADAIRKNVAYRYFNLLSPFSFRRPFHAIYCRNVMIYFDAPTKNEVVNKFYNALLPGGYFFIGHSESLSSCRHQFKYVLPSVYRKEG